MKTNQQSSLSELFRGHRSIGVALVGLCLAGSVGLGFVISNPAVGAAGPTAGKIPESAFGPNGAIDENQVPDFVSVAGPNGDIIGYVNRSAILPQTAPGTAVGSSPPQAQVIPVYGPDLTTIIGHMYPSQGFVPLGTGPAAVPTIPSTVEEGVPATNAPASASP
jgi:hypothetical protein